MKIQRMPEDIVPLLNDIMRKITALENRPFGTVFVNETIVTKDPETGVETIIGDLTEYGEDRTGIKQWVNDTEPPAIPVKPIVTSNLGVFSIVWTGFFKDDAPMAPDFSHINVYGNNGTSTNLVGVIKTQDEVAIVTLSGEDMYDQTWSFWFTSVDQVGNESAPGEISSGNKVLPLVEAPDIQGAIDEIIEKTKEDFEKAMESANGKNRIWHLPEPPDAATFAPFKDGDTWFDTNDGNKIYIWKSLPAPGKWESAVLDSSALDDKITNAITKAQNDANTAISTANGKNKAWHSPTAPPGTNHNVGDIWFDTDDDNKIYVWNGTKWDPSTASAEIPQSVLDDILYAKNKADQAMISANGKNRIVDSTSAKPTATTGYINGDIWRKWSSLGTTGVLLQSWTVKNGAWVEDSMDASYLPKVDIGQGTFGSLNGDRLIANTVSAEKILVSATDNLNRDPNFNFPDTMWANLTSDMGVGPEKWSTEFTYAGGTRSMVLTQKPQGSNQASYAATPSDYYEVVPGDSYAAFSMVYSDGGTDPSMTYIAQRVYFYDKNKTILSGGPGNANVGDITNAKWVTQTWNKVGGVSVATAPENAAYMKPRVTVYRTANTTPGTRKYYVGSISVMRAMDSTLITPEAIKTPHIATGAITAESGIIASLDAGKITTGSMHGKFIEAGTLLASTIAVRDNMNLLPNITYEAGSWGLSTGVSIIDSTLSAEKKRFNFPATALAQAISPDVQVIPGEKIKIECSTYGTTATQNLELCWFGRDGKGVSAGSAVLIKSTTQNQRLVVEWEVPSTVFSVRFSVRVPSTSPVNTAVTGAYNFTARKMTGGVLIESGAVTAEHMKTGTITADSGIIGSLDASKITTGSMHGKFIEANTISVDRLLVSSTDNIIPDPQFTNNAGDWGAPTSNYSFPVNEGYGGGSSLKITRPTASQLGKYSMFMPSTPGASYRTSIWVKASASVPIGAISIYARVERRSTGAISTANTGSNTEVIPANTWYLISSTYEVIEDSKTISFGIFSQTSLPAGVNVWCSDFRATRMSDGLLVVSGSILADHIHADAIESRHIKANAITADKVEAGAIRATHLAVGTGRELVGNGSGQLKNNNGFEGFTYSTRSSSTPVGHPGYFKSTAGQGTTNFLTGENILRIKPNTKYKISTWVLASATGSKVFLEPMVGSTAAGERPVPTYVFSDMAVPNTWTYWESIIETKGAPAGTMYFRWFLNHSNGTNTNTIFYFTGFSVEEMVEGTVISDGAITTDKIAANTITAEKLVIGVGSNLFPDPLIKDVEAWNVAHSSYSVVNNGGRNASGNALRITAATGQTGGYFGVASDFASRRIPVVPSRSYRITAWVKPSVSTAGTNIAMYCRLYPRSGVPTNKWTVPSNGNAGYLGTVSNTVWNKFEIEVQVPADTDYTFLTPGFYVQSGFTTGATIDWCDISITEMSSGELIVDGAIDGKTITGALIQTDRASNVGVKLSNEGIIAFGPDGEKTLSITGGNGNGIDYMGIWGNEDAVMSEDGTVTYPTGVLPEQVASIDYKGEMASRTLSVSTMGRFDGNIVMDGDPLTDSHLGSDSSPGEYGPVMSGRSLLGSTFKNFVEQHPQVSDVNSWLTPLSHGFLANAYTNTGVSGTLNSAGRWVWSGGSGGLVDRMMLTQTIDVVNNRGYLITYYGPAVRNTDGSNGTAGASVLQYRVGDGLGIANGTTIPGSRFYLPGGGEYANPGGTVFVVGGQDIPAGTVTLGIMLYTYTNKRLESTDTADARYWSISVIDSGLATKGNTGDVVNYYRKLPVTPSEPEETTPPPPPPKPKPTRYTKTWSANWWSTYETDGSKNTYYENRGRVAQGNPPGSAGRQKGLIGFPSVTTTLSGSKVIKVEVYMYAAHAYYNSGFTAVIGTHGATSEPSSYTGGSLDLKRQAFKKPEGRWVTLPSSVHAGFKDGSRRGVVLYIGSDSLSYYGYMTGSKSKLRITYEK